MKIKIRDLRPNPFRNIKKYPIHKGKIETLKSSIKETGFWDNILARKVDDKIQIAYGHHRHEALKQLYGGDHIIDIPVKPLTDALMLQIMANENMEDWKTEPTVIDETVKAARDFLEANLEEAKKYGQVKSGSHEPNFIGKSIIARFLHWNETRVHYSLERIRLIEDEEILSEEAIQELPTEAAARNFVRAMRKREAEDQRPSRATQKSVARMLVAGGEENFSVNHIEKEFINREQGSEKKQQQKENKRIQDLEEFALELSQTADSLLIRLKKFIMLKREIPDALPGRHTISLFKTLGEIVKQNEIINNLRPVTKNGTPKLLKA